MATVRAFTPRSIDPPRYVAEDGDELDDRIGDLVPAEQCDGCGNSIYRLTKEGRRYWMICAEDPDEDPEFKHPNPCGSRYPVEIWEEDLVVF